MVIIIIIIRVIIIIIIIIMVNFHYALVDVFFIGHYNSRFNLTAQGVRELKKRGAAQREGCTIASYMSNKHTARHIKMIEDIFLSIWQCFKFSTVCIWK